MATRLAILCALLLAFSGVTHAAITWDGGGDGASWSDPNNWDLNRLPGATGFETETILINPVTPGSLTVTIDCNAQGGVLQLAQTYTEGDSVTLVLNDANYSLTLKADSQVIIAMGDSTAVATFNQSAGRVTLRNINTGATQVGGEARIFGYSAYNLSGGVLDAERMRKASSGDTTTNGLYCTGGTVVGRGADGVHARGNYYSMLGLASSSDPALNCRWYQGGALLAPGDIGTIGAFRDGNSKQTQDHLTEATSVVEIDVGAGTDDPNYYDRIWTYGKVDATSGTLRVKNVGYTPLAEGDYLYLWVVTKLKMTATGTFDVVESEIPYDELKWVTGIDPNTADPNYAGYEYDPNIPQDPATGTSKVMALRLHVIPEPATLALLLMGWSALVVRRRMHLSAKRL